MKSEIERHDAGPCTVLRLRGKFDLESHAALKEIFAELLSSDQPRTVLNLSSVQVISSTVVGAFVAFMRDCQAIDGAVVLAELSRTAETTLHLLRLDELFRVYASEAEAVAALSSP